MCIWFSFFVFFFKQKTAYEIYQCDWSSDVCSSDLWAGSAYDAVYAETGVEAWRDPAALRPPGGESFADLVARLGRALDRFDPAANAGDAFPRDVIAVAHVGTVRAALAHALGLAPAAALRFCIAPLSLTRIDRLAGDDGWLVTAVNHGSPGAD